MSTATQRMAVALITSKQVGLVFAIAREAGIQSEQDILEWIEFDSGLDLQLFKVEEIQASVLDTILKRLRLKSQGRSV